MQDYFLLGLKDQNNSLIQHKINLSITYNAASRRDYYSANFCDKWQGCDDEPQVDINVISADASGCASSTCNYREVMGLDLTDDFLRKNIDTGFSISFNAKRFKNKINIPSAYIKGYLKVAN